MMPARSGVESTLIVGGGPAGAAAALTLARAGHPVTLLEREAASRNKVCGEFLSAEALDFLAGLGYPLEHSGALPIERVRLASGTQYAEAQLPFAARSFTRLCLDPLLLQAAQEAGATVLRGCTVEQLKPHAEGWQVTLDRDGNRDTLRATRAILATGKHDLRGLPRAAGAQNDLVAMKMYFRLTPAQEEALAGGVELLLHPEGYTGLQAVQDGVANVTALVRRRHLAKVGGWTGLLHNIQRSSTHAARRLEGAEPLLPRPLALSSIPYGFVRREALAETLYAVGDQAAVIPSFTGDGMSMALYGGQLAARSILEGRSASAFQCEFHRAVRWQVARATALSRALVVPSGQRALMTAARAWPGGLRLAAKLTRLPEAATVCAVQS